MENREDVQCRENPAASVSCDFCKGGDVVLQRERNSKVRVWGKGSGFSKYLALSQTILSLTGSPYRFRAQNHTVWLS